MDKPPSNQDYFTHNVIVGIQVFVIVAIVIVLIWSVF